MLSWSEDARVKCDKNLKTGAGKMKAIGKTLVVLFSVMFLGPFPLFAGVEEGDAGVQFAGMDDGWNVPEESVRVTPFAPQRKVPAELIL